MMIKKDLDRLKENIGNLISPNGFFSTSKDLDVALIYASDDNDELESILFDITIDRAKLKNTSKIVVADIEHFSRSPDEKEVLFGIGTICKIDDIFQDSVLQKCRIKIIVSDEALEHVQKYTEFIRKELEETNSTRLFGKLLVELGQYLKAESHFKLVLKILSKNHLDIAKSCISLGCDYRESGNYRTAVELLKEALMIREHNYSGRDHYNIATTLMSIGVTYTYLGDYENALNFLIQALDMYQRLLPSDHPVIASALVKFGNLFEKKYQYHDALIYYQHAYDMAEKILPIEHPRLLEYFQYIINIYKKINRIDDAIQLSNEKLAHYRQLLEETHSSIVQFHIIIKYLHDSNEQYLSNC
ncbi:unnamed protein product [Rotaria sp. Silwood1]|nr:unnamed protein product [Rotaria sp. Silwood1]CAF4864886.1 unnamed protein product [Rotaria sp. Silwood1]